MKTNWVGDRLAAPVLRPRAGVLPLDTVALPAAVRSRARRSAERRRSSGARTPDGACERAGPGTDAASAAAPWSSPANIAQWFFKNDRLRRSAARLFRRSGGPSGWSTAQRPLDRTVRGRRGSCSKPRGAGERTIPVFTTRPDTLFGATFFVLAPEHPLVERHHRPRRPESGGAARVPCAGAAAAKRGEERAAGGAKKRHRHGPRRRQYRERGAHPRSSSPTMS